MQETVLGLSGKGYWRKSACPQMHQAMTKQWFGDIGLYNFLSNN